MPHVSRETNSKKRCLKKLRKRIICKLDPMRTLFILLVLSAIAIPNFAQLKYERETRIKRGDVPKDALNFIDSLNFGSRIKWYKEIGLETIAYEAKTKSAGKRYSIKFLQDGSLVDVEIEVKPNELPDETYSAITKYLANKHNKYSIEKIQIQYTGEPSIILEFLQGKRSDSDLKKNYEIVISSKVDRTYTMLEYLFSSKGEFIHELQIVLNRTENIVY